MKIRPLFIPAVCFQTLFSILLLLYTVPSHAQTVFVDPGAYPGNQRVAISGFSLDGDGWLWWDNGPNCSVEFHFDGKVGYKALSNSAHQRLAASCLVNPLTSSPARDEAYSYFFASLSEGDDYLLYKKALAAEEADEAILFDADGTSIELTFGNPSRLWVTGDYLYYQRTTVRLIGGITTQMMRVPRDGSAPPEVFASITGEHFITEFDPFTYLAGSPFATQVTGHLLLTSNRDLFVRASDGTVTLSRENVYDIAVITLSIGLSTSTVYTVENSGNEENAIANLFSISPLTGSGNLLRSWQGFHFLKVELANWPNNSPGRVFLHRAVPGAFGSYHSHTCQRQTTGRNFVDWELFLSTDFEGSLTGSREWVYYVHDSKIKGKSSDAPPELIDVEALGIEVTQGVQSLDHSAILVAGKETFVRGYGRLSENTTPKPQWLTTARLYGSRAGSDLPGSPLSPLQLRQLGDEDTLPNQRNTDESYLFRLPDSWTTAGNTSFELRLNEPGGVPETGSDANNRSATLDFVSKQNTFLKLRPLRTTVQPYYADAPGSGLADILRRTEAMLPVAGFDILFDNNLREKPVFFVEMEYIVCFPLVCPIPVIKIRHDPFYLEDSTDNDGSWAIFWLGVDRLMERDPGDDYHIVGTVHPDLPVFNGIGGRSDISLTELWDEFPDIVLPDTDFASVLAVKMRTDPARAVLELDGSTMDVPFNTFYGGRTLAHELGHNYGRKHINQDIAMCGGSVPDGPFDIPPFNACTFGPPSSSSAADTVAGFDGVTLTTVRNDLALTGDLLTYADARWTSVWNWNIVANMIPNSPAQLIAALESEMDEEKWIVVKGFYDTITGEAFLMPSEILPTGIIPPEKVSLSLMAEGEMPAESLLEFCQFDKDGGVLSAHKAVPFAMPQEAEAPQDQLWFVQIVPCEPGMHSIALCEEEAMLAWMPRSPNPPHITVLDPIVDPENSLLHLSWDAFDPDGTPLLFSVYFTHDGGATWRSLGSELDKTELTVSTRRLPGGDQCQIRIIACDGLDTAVDLSEPFELALSTPEVQISNLLDGMRFSYGESIMPSLFAYDNEDGVLIPEWSIVGIESHTGEGTNPIFPFLAPGEYLFMATATDSRGQQSSLNRVFEVLPIEVPDSDEPILDGYSADSAYESAAVIRVPLTSGEVTTNLVHSDESLYVSISDIPYSGRTGTASVGILIDTDGDAEDGESAGAAERGFYVDENGLPYQSSGNGTNMAIETEPPLAFFAAIQRGSQSWSAEFRIHESLIGGWDHAARLLIRVDSAEGGTLWPPIIGHDQIPSTWAPAWFGTLPEPANQMPTAIAPESFVTLASRMPSITIDGSASADPEGSELNYTWTQLSGPPISLENSDPSKATFATPTVSSPTPLTFRLVVDDGELSSQPTDTTVLLLPDPVLFEPDGTNGSPLIVVAVDSSDPNSVVVDFAGQPGSTYEIQSSMNLEDWAPLTSKVADITGQFSHTQPMEAENALFIRAAEME